MKAVFFLYLGLIKFSLASESFPGLYSYQDLRKNCGQLRTRFGVLAKPHKVEAALVICCLKDHPGQISELADKIARYLEELGPGRVEAELSLSESVDGLIESGFSGAKPWNST